MVANRIAMDYTSGRYEEYGANKEKSDDHSIGGSISCRCRTCGAFSFLIERKESMTWAN